MTLELVLEFLHGVIHPLEASAALQLLLILAALEILKMQSGNQTALKQTPNFVLKMEME